MRFDLVVAAGSLVTPGGVFTGSVGITGGRIVAVSRDRLDGEEALDARGRVILPGAVDLHVHFNEPGRAHWEGWAHGSRAAAAGGVTTVVEMPLNAVPPTTTVAALEAKIEAARAQSAVDFALWGGLIPGNLDDLPALSRAGVIGFKAFMSRTGTPEFAHVDDATLRDGLARIARLGAFLAVHAENDAMTAQGAARLRAQGRRDPRAWAESRPPEAELDAIERALGLSAGASCPLHVVHLSIPEGADAIARARRAGQRVTVETCPHYLVLTGDDLVRLGPVAKCAPPLRDRAGREGLWRALLAGEIDCVASDHSPCPTEDKARDDVFEAWGGISGVQTLVPLMLAEGVHRRGMRLERLADLVAATPARIAGLWPRKGAIQAGADADLVIVDLDREWALERGWLRSRHPHSPFVGRPMKGWIERVILRGRTIARDGEVTAGTGGEWARGGQARA